MLQLLAGLLYAHEKGIVHADVKPSNILVHEVSDQGLPSIWLCDFNISAGKQVNSEIMMSAAGRTKGYESPEQQEQIKKGCLFNIYIYTELTPIKIFIALLYIATHLNYNTLTQTKLYSNPVTISCMCYV